jgi:hypothetical protein
MKDPFNHEHTHPTRDCAGFHDQGQEQAGYRSGHCRALIALQRECGKTLRARVTLLTFSGL